MFAKLPLTALRGFESAARLGSFKAAAQELNISPAAISHQVKSLEAFLGVQLFERSSQNVRLSADGERLQPHIHRALLDIQHGLQILSPPCTAQSLVVSTTPAFRKPLADTPARGFSSVVPGYRRQPAQQQRRSGPPA